MQYSAGFLLKQISISHTRIEPKSCFFFFFKQASTMLKWPLSFSLPVIQLAYWYYCYNTHVPGYVVAVRLPEAVLRLVAFTSDASAQ